MRPIRLYLHGFNSFYRPAEIDFETLGEAGVFGIFGKTGSGKTTIVDALIFALYGATGRALDSIDYVNRRLSRAEVRLTFAIAEPDGSCRFYEAARTIAVDRIKNAAKPAKAELFDVTGARVSLAVGVRDVNARIAGLIGLDLREFSNCIILEQNEYDKFVKATDSERKAIVGALFGLQKFGPGLTERLRARESELNAADARVEGRLGELTATPEMLNAGRAALADCERALGALRERESELAAAVERGRDAAEKARRREELLRRSAEAGARLDDARRQAAGARAEYEDYRSRAEGSVTELGRRIEACTRRLAQLETVRDTDARIAALTAARDRAAGEIAACAAEIADREREERARADYIAAREQSRARGIERFAALAGVRPPAEPETETLACVTAYAREFDAAVRRYGAATERARAEEAALAGLRAELARQKKERETCAEAVRAATAARAAVETALGRARAELETARRIDLAATLARGLCAGDVCPVCGGRLDAEPVCPESSDLGAREAALGAAEAELAAAERAQTAHTGRLHTADALYLTTAEAIRNRETALVEAQRERAATGLDDGCGERLAQIEEIEKKFTALSAQLRQAYAERTVNAGKLDLARARRAGAERAYGEAERDREQESARRAAVAGESLVAEALAAATAERDDAERARREWERGVEQRRAAAESAASACGAAAAVYEQAAQETAALGEVDFDAAAFGRLRAELDAARGERETRAAERERLRAETERLDGELARRRAALKEKAALDRRRRLLDCVRKMTRGGALMEWLAEEYIQDFTALASEKLYALTDGELELKYSSRGFTVTDNFNDREERKVATVSGGETFLVSLALAVSIAAKLEERAGAGRVEFLFIDEGFGTLSQDKLDAVMEALNALGRERFTVGFISHVAEMQERIARKLIVRREDAELGSVTELI